jgi:hypothetical protein
LHAARLCKYEEVNCATTSKTSLQIQRDVIVRVRLARQHCVLLLQTAFFTHPKFPRVIRHPFLPLLPPQPLRRVWSFSTSLLSLHCRCPLRIPGALVWECGTLGTLGICLGIANKISRSWTRRLNPIIRVGTRSVASAGCALHRPCALQRCAPIPGSQPSVFDAQCSGTTASAVDTITTTT